MGGIVYISLVLKKMVQLLHNYGYGCCGWLKSELLWALKIACSFWCYDVMQVHSSSCISNLNDFKCCMWNCGCDSNYF